MLHYTRRNKHHSQRLQYESGNIKTVPLLTYCNWSYAPEHHIDLDTLQMILRSFNREYIPFYLRIFNETPSKVLDEFLEQYLIPRNSLQTIYRALKDDGFRIKALF
jgi:hypothetical protein